MPRSIRASCWSFITSCSPLHSRLGLPFTPFQILPLIRSIQVPVLLTAGRNIQSRNRPPVSFFVFLLCHSCILHSPSYRSPSPSGLAAAVDIQPQFKCVLKKTVMLFRNVYDSTGIESSWIEAGERHDSQSSKKMCAPGLFLRSNHGQILQCHVRGHGKDSRHRLPLRT